MSDSDMVKTLRAAAANGLVEDALSAETVTKAAILATLNALGGSLTQEDALTFEGDKFVIPRNYEGRLKEAAMFLLSHEEQQEAKTDMKRVFPYRAYDVAHAVQAVLRDFFGTTGTGQAITTLSGSIEPEFVTIPTGVGQTAQVPWNRVRFDMLSGHIDIGSTRSPNGTVGVVVVNVPRKFRSVVEGFFVAVEQKLKDESIYRGKAIVSGDDDVIQFLDLSKVKREDVVYGDQVMHDIAANLWVPLQYTQELRDAGQAIKRAVLLEGPYGTGKSLAGYLTAQVAVAHQWTFVFVKPGSNLTQAMQTAKLYAPAVVFFEDIDVLQSNDPEAVSNLLDAFDGIGGKGQEVIAILTTNHKDKIHKGMLRPGRLDALIHIADLDQGGVERLIKAAFRDSGVELKDLDYAAIFKAAHGYLPAFVKEVATRARMYAMVHANGIPKQLVTEDFVAAANGLRPQFELMTDAHETQPEEGLAKAFHNAVAGVLENVTPLDEDDDPSRLVRKFEVPRK